MAALTDADRTEIWKDFMSQLSAKHELHTTPLTKVDIRAAVDAIDQWVSDNAAAGNAAIPQPARSGLTTSQKARLQSLVVLKRFSSETI